MLNHARLHDVPQGLSNNSSFMDILPQQSFSTALPGTASNLHAHFSQRQTTSGMFILYAIGAHQVEYEIFSNSPRKRTH